MKKNDKVIKKEKRAKRIRKNIVGTNERPRLSVYKSLSNIYAQIIDDTKGVTLVAASSKDKELKDKLKYGGNIKAAEAVGELIAKKAGEKNIKKVVFDRGSFLYHGRVKSLATKARENGLEF